MESRIEKIVIVGGGAAGWLTAGVIAAEHCTSADSIVQVTLVESPDVRTIGVGEGTWPTMRDTLRRIGVSESDLFRQCDASFKQGSKFVGWVTGGDDDYYYHPFVLPQGYTETSLVQEWQRNHQHVPFADLVSFQPHLCEQGRAPKQVSTPEFAAVANYAYHLDAGKFGDYLRDHCTANLGVTHVQDHVTGINATENGDIASLQMKTRGAIAGDLFVDCTGFAALLIGKHYDIPFLGRESVLFNDTALAVQVPYTNADEPIASQTISTAQSAGWVWDIGLPTRRGVGHVYASRYQSDDEAAKTLLDYVRATASPEIASEFEPRKISINPGHREKFWHRNCIAVGISAGFIEPLEASALALIELSAAMIADELPEHRAAMDLVARRFNDRFSYRWERVIDFLKLHYVLSRRDDSQYWIDNRDPETIPVRLQELLQLWRQQPPSSRDFYQVEEIFPSASYQYVLYGMGGRLDSPRRRRRSDDAERADGFFRESARLTSRMLAALPSNRELIEHVRAHGMTRI